MTVNKEKWQELAEKYDTKAKWAEAIILLNPEDHEDLISALIELDPQDIVDANDAELRESDSGYHFNISGMPMVSSEEIVRLLADINRGYRSR